MSNNSPNIAVVVLDTLRYDYFEEYFEWLPGTRFENAWSTSHWTLPVHASVYTGHYPSEIGVHAERPELNCDSLVLAERLQNAGYRTTGYTCNMVVGDTFGFDRGFDRLKCLGYQKRNLRHTHDSNLFDWSTFIRKYQPHDAPWRYPLAVWKCFTAECNTFESLKYGYELKFGRSNNEESDMGAQRVLKHLQRHDADTEEYLYLNLMETHTPYQIPDKYKTVSDDAIRLPDNPVDSIESNENIDVKAIKTRYGNAVQYLSDIYREIFDELREDYDYIFTLADHGELLGEHSHLAHSSGIYPELTHVPVSLYYDDDTATTDETLISLLDIHRTVLEIANLDAKDSRGRNLLDDDIVDKDLNTGFLTEYHGIPFPSKNRDRLREWAKTQTVVDGYLDWRRGITFPGYYGYDSIEKFVENGTAPIDDVQAEIDQLTANFDESNIGNDGKSKIDLSTEIESNLEDLGYIG